MSAKRVAVKFDDELFLVNGTYYYRGTPLWSDVRLEFSLGLKEGVTQKEVLLTKEEKLDEYKLKGVRNLKDNFAGLSAPYIADREEEAKDPTLLSAGSLYETKYILRSHLVPYFGNYKPHDIDQSLFEDYSVYKRKAKVKGRKKIGVNLVNHRKVLNHFMKWLFHKKAVSNLVSFEIPKKARAKRRERIVPEEWEIIAIFEHATGNMLLYISYYAFMGVRNLESLASAWDDHDLKKAVMNVRGENNRTRKDRSVPINPFVLALLIIRKKTAVSKWVFVNQRDITRHKSKSAMMKQWHKLVAKAGVNPNLLPHDLRAFFETRMHENTDFTDTQREKMAGANIDVQKRIYTKMQAESLRGLENSVQIKALDKVLSSKVPTFRGGNTGGKKRIVRPSKPVKVRKKKGKAK